MELCIFWSDNTLPSHCRSQVLLVVRQNLITTLKYGIWVIIHLMWVLVVHYDAPASVAPIL